MYAFNFKLENLAEKTAIGIQSTWQRQAMYVYSNTGGVRVTNVAVEK